jgi:cyclic pyranopterin phosphate synthase
MFDRFNRNITYLRISVTDRCNLRCRYCMPEEGVALKDHNEILSFEEITDIVKTGVKLGINKIRLTGGEPLVRKDVAELIRMIKAVDGIEDIGLTTNGTLLPKLAEDLWNAGLRRLNISLDTINKDKYREITRTGKLDEVLAGIEIARKLGFDPIKINFVRIPGVNEEDEKEVKQFCSKHGLKIRFIRQMDLATGKFYPVEGGSGGTCSICNRLRLTADGKIIPCLFSDVGYSTREFGIEEAFAKALHSNPKKGKISVNHNFYNIGG